MTLQMSTAEYDSTGHEGERLARFSHKYRRETV